MTGTVVHLAFRRPDNIDSDMMAFFACKACRNKTYTLTEDRTGDFPLMRCAACGNHMGRIGWVDDEERAGA